MRTSSAPIAGRPPPGMASRASVRGFGSAPSGSLGSHSGAGGGSGPRPRADGAPYVPDGRTDARAARNKAAARAAADGRIGLFIEMIAGIGPGAAARSRAAAARTGPAAAMTRTADPDPAPTVLVIEDEALVALLVEDLLAEAGYRTGRARDWRPAAPGAGPAAAVVDLRLGDGLDGRDVVRRLRRERPGMPVVVLTGFGADAPEADLRGLGGPTVRLHKPQDLDELPGRLAEVLMGAIARTAPRRRKADRPVLAPG